MAKNSELESAVHEMMARMLVDKSTTLLVVCRGDVDLARDVIRLNGNLQVDKEYRVRCLFENFLGYGYDFRKRTEDGGSAQVMYDNAIKNTKLMSGSRYTETFMHGEVQGNLGLYLTKV